jgi:GDP-4-dehydro-6-deoxy-D-mannose reductase
MKVLITGISGFAGSHLAEYLLAKKNIKVCGIDIKNCNLNNIKHIKKEISLYQADITNFNSIRKVIREVKPDRIFHLAAKTFVGASFGLPQETFYTNIIGQLNIFEAVKSLKINPLIQVSGSSDEYGLVLRKELPIKETNLLRPLSPYAVSKVAQDLLGFQYFKSYGLKIIRTRAFNHCGARMAEVFVASSFAKQIAMIENKKQKAVIRVGNLKAVRDFSDVRDIVRAYWLTLEKCEPGEVYNICSQKSYEIRELLDILLSYSGVKVRIEKDPQRIRPSDTPVLVGSCEKFRNATGWKPEISFEKTLKDLLDYWRQNI